jgi:hypothetical protein
MNQLQGLCTVDSRHHSPASSKLCFVNAQVALRELQHLVEPSLASLKLRLEERVKLSRGQTMLERLDFFTQMAR